MKGTLTDFFDGCAPEELDALLGEGLREDLPEEADPARLRRLALEKAGLAEPAARKKFSARRWRHVAAAAACLCLAIGICTVAADAYEYREAVEFFAANSLSAEGLTRGEIKAVYRDITTETFSCAVTAQVLQNSAPAGVEGFEIAQDQPETAGAEDLRAMWERWGALQKSGVHYEGREEYRLDEELGFEVLDKSFLERYDGVELQWSVPFIELYIQDTQPVDGGVVAWGQTPTWSSKQRSNAWLTKVDEGGKLLWKVMLSHGFDREYIAAVVENGDGSYAVFSRGDLQYLVVSRYSGAGEELSTRATEVGDLGIWGAARLGEDYIVHLGNQSSGIDRLVKIGRDGTLSDAFTYTSEDCDYYITGMADFGGKLYLSAYSVPKLPEGAEDAGGRYEIAAILDEILSRDGWEIDGGELTAMLREHYTAVLLVCDPQEGTPETFYTVRGSLGGALDGSGGTLRWDVESVADAIFSPVTNAYSIAGTCRVFRYTFSPAGELLSREDTGEVTQFAR